ncbi:hypothetical protein [Listeria costaricensis]|uniref:hypothetical protein n=1 Tax=Listeria costaricensis TaxID=2026604 RepID=UPI0013C4F86B|nr:hypothetical protein [Listeria costaricensis]
MGDKHKEKTPKIEVQIWENETSIHLMNNCYWIFIRNSKDGLVDECKTAFEMLIQHLQ